MTSGHPSALSVCCEAVNYYVRLQSSLTSPTAYKVAIIAVVLVGSALRLYNLGGESIWWDEAYAIRVMSQPAPLEIIHLSSLDNNPPLYYLLLHYWMLIAGDSEVAVRLPSAIFGALAVPLIWRIGVLLFDRGVGLLAALLLALSSFHIRYSQEARGYALMGFLALLSFYFFLRIAKGRASHYMYAGYIISTSLLLYSHFYGVFLVLAQIVYLLVSREDLGKWIVPAGALVVLCSPWLVMLAVNILAPTGAWSNTMYWLPEPTPEDVGRIFLIFSGSFPFSLPLALVLAALAGYSFVGSAGKPGLPRARLLLASWLLVPILVPFALSYLYSPMLLERYAIAASFAYYLLAAQGLRGVRKIKGSKGGYAQVLLAVLIAILSVAGTLVYFTTITNERWRELASYVDRHSRPMDLVLIYWPEGLLTFDYYSDKNGIVSEGFDAESGTAVTEKNIKAVAARGGTSVTPANASGVSSLVEGHERVWLVIFWDCCDKRRLLKRQMRVAYGPPIDRKAYYVNDPDLYVAMHPYQSDLQLFLFQKTASH